ncbi:MAG: hypothetical protein E7041_00690 [Lentisphaerae bacterium]|nr:hypothetical protein [Lentisphaerota bacterium]MBQ9803324.1 hypothetical protein [Lentisphaeria bacterium]
MKRTLIICGALAASTLLITGCVYHSCGGGMPGGKNWQKKHCAPQPNCEEVETMTIEAVAVPNNAPAPQNAPAPAAPKAPATN